MTIPCHLLISWHVARYLTPDVERRRWIAWAGVLPDLDGVGLLVDTATGRTNLYEAWHHLAGHNIFAAVLMAALAGGFTRSAVAAIGAFACFHVHLAGDLLSGRGPDGSSWPVLYFWPVSDLEWQWSGQWRLDAWPNTAVFLTLAAWAVVAAHRTSRSPVELACPTRVDRKVIDAFRSVFGRRAVK